MKHLLTVGWAYINRARTSNKAVATNGRRVGGDVREREAIDGLKGSGVNAYMQREGKGSRRRAAMSRKGRGEEVTLTGDLINRTDWDQELRDN
jgi:hypothetical protein